MAVVKIVSEDWEIESRLRDEFDASKEEVIEIVRAAVGARRDAIDDDPVNAPGLLSYIFGTRAIRTIFRSKGWKISRLDNIEATYDPVRRAKIVFQNADHAADLQRKPKAVSDKGPTAERAVKNGQMALFPDMQKEQEEAEIAATAAVWYLFVSADGDDVRAELSCPDVIEGGQFKDFHERIFILQPGEWSRLEVVDDGASAAEQEFEINVTRK